MQISEPALVGLGDFKLGTKIINVYEFGQAPGGLLLHFLVKPKDTFYIHCVRCKAGSRPRLGQFGGGMEYTRLGQRRRNVLEAVDSLPPELRKAVHEFGFPIVATLMKFNIRSYKAISEIVHTIWLGPRDGTSQTGRAMGALDDLLAKEVIGVVALQNFLTSVNYKVVPVQPTGAMIEASMAEVADFTIACTKYEKHRRRLTAAIAAAPNLK